MSKRFICWACFVLVSCSLASVANADLTEGLVAYWTFDDGSGITAVDSVGGHHGTLVGGPVWMPPGDYKIGTGALHFDGSDDVVAIEPFDVIGGGITLAAWMKPDSFGINDGRVISKANEWGANDHWWMLSTIASGGAQRLRFRLKTNDGQAVPTLIASSGELRVGEWHHWAATWDGTTMRLYSNTVEAGSTPKGGTAVATDPTVSVAIGSQPPDAFAPATPDHVVKYFHGVIDDVGVWNRALSPDELKALWNDGAGTPVVEQAKASDPRPQNEATDVPRDVVLTWTPGVYAPATNGHKVYFSESFNDVNDGLGGIAQDASSYDPGRLAFETRYYWRVDEVNGPPDFTVFPGDLWSFTTEPVGYPVDGASITATASSVGQADFGPEKTIDGSGLDPNDLHSTEPLDMWLSGDEPLGAWIQYEFDKVHKLYEMWVWNSNQIFEALFGFGMKDVTVEYSTNGADWTALAGVSEFARAPGTAGYAHDTTVDFGGAVAKYVRLTATGNWGGVLPQYGLSEVRFFSIPVSAREPSPGSGAADVDVEATLSWRAGRGAAAHDVYLSTDQQAVIDGTVPAVSVTEASYSAALDLGSTYYWRIDEVNEAETPTTWKGDVWSFSTPEYLVVDDFESYNDIDPPDPKSNRIFESWSDGYNVATNGALIGHDPPQPSYTETTIVHDGDQSLPLFYNNTGGAAYSETARTFAPGQDWTKYGVKTLVLWFHGTPDNAGGQLYV
ncbi:MAG: LamG-like jellyroll fold domain-containing protein, partial [Planctomycetota bacterium]